MPKPFILLALFVALAGCSDGVSSIQLNEKTKLTAELIKSSKECKRFIDTLSTAEDSEKIDHVYEEAMKAHCIKSDI